LSVTSDESEDSHSLIVSTKVNSSSLQREKKLAKETRVRESNFSL